ncbi:hypothetical protein [Haladaptatus sp. DYSN1]|uniref:hypothetical protein n=1 Tax=unclassified Haladaptatus TaxID=2622732 RepID=UPI00240761F5|nr:hypothetical protein [Haladaptatus sp. DYSN1]
MLTRCETTPDGIDRLLQCDVLAALDLDAASETQNRQKAKVFDRLVSRTVLGNT